MKKHHFNKAIDAHLHPIPIQMEEITGTTPPVIYQATSYVKASTTPISQENFRLQLRFALNINIKKQLFYSHAQSHDPQYAT